MVFLGLAAVTLMSQLSACATRPANGAPSGSQVVGNRDMSLGLTGGEIPPLLASITASPYRVANPSNCDEMAREVAELTKVLGPDVDIDVSKVRDPKVERAMIAALRGAIPYRWVVRWMTGAGRRDRELLIAVRAGTARRAYLKGLMHGSSCSPLVP